MTDLTIRTTKELVTYSFAHHKKSLELDSPHLYNALKSL
jgi:hypothetical protein